MEIAQPGNPDDKPKALAERLVVCRSCRFLVAVNASGKSIHCGCPAGCCGTVGHVDLQADHCPLERF